MDTNNKPPRQYRQRFESAQDVRIAGARLYRSFMRGEIDAQQARTGACLLGVILKAKTVEAINNNEGLDLSVEDVRKLPQWKLDLILDGVPLREVLTMHVPPPGFVYRRERKISPEDFTKKFNDAFGVSSSGG